MGNAVGCCVTQDTRNTKIYNASVIVIVSFLIVFLLIYTDVLGAIQLSQVDNSLRVIFLLGLVGSFSTCLAMTGGVIMGCTELVDLESEKGANTKFHLLLHAGRLIAFFVFGCVLGLIGETFILSLGVSTWMSILIALMFIYISLYVLGIVKMPTYGGGVTQTKITSRLGNQSGYKIAPIIGALTFIIPCGFTQSTQLLALASGSRYMGGLMMLVYALGNTPGLLLLGLGTGYAKQSMKAGLQTLVATVLMVFAMFTLWGSASVLGWTRAVHNVASISAGATIEKITLSHNGYGLIPKTTFLQTGKNYEITILPTANGIGCKSRMVFPGLDIDAQYVTSGQPIIYMLNDVQPGSYDILCASGSPHGGFVVEDV